MSAKAIREFDGKLLLSHFLQGSSKASLVANVAFEPAVLRDDAKKSQHVEAVFQQAEKQCPWLLTTPLVCKPDQLIKRRGKNGLLGIKLAWPAVKDWIRARAGQLIKASIFN